MSSIQKVDPKLRMLFDQMPGAWGCKDLNSNFMYANEEYSKIIGMENHLDIIGMTDFDMPCDTVNCAQMFQNQDQSVIRTGEKMRILDIHPFAGYKWKAYIFTKTPLRDDSNEIIGTIFHGADVTNSSIVEIGSILSKVTEDSSGPLVGQSSYSLGSHNQKITLTARQSEVLFFLLRGKTCEKIATILKVSVRTIHDHTEVLKYKFFALNKYELIDKAIEMGYLNIIPESLFKKQLSLALEY